MVCNSMISQLSRVSIIYTKLKKKHFLAAEICYIFDTHCTAFLLSLISLNCSTEGFNMKQISVEYAVLIHRSTMAFTSLIVAPLGATQWYFIANGYIPWWHYISSSKDATIKCISKRLVVWKGAGHFIYTLKSYLWMLHQSTPLLICVNARFSLC